MNRAPEQKGVFFVVRKKKTASRIPAGKHSTARQDSDKRTETGMGFAVLNTILSENKQRSGKSWIFPLSSAKIERRKEIKKAGPRGGSEGAITIEQRRIDKLTLPDSLAAGLKELLKVQSLNRLKKGVSKGILLFG